MSLGRMTLLALAIILCSPLVAMADGPWPQWRGPDRNDLSSETGLLRDWPAGGPRRLWLVEDCGLGYAGPAIVGDRLYILGTRGDQERLFCRSVADGKEIWSAPVGPIFENSWGDGPRSTPTVDGNRVYAMGASGNLVCVEIADGAMVWRQTMQYLGGELPDWGYTESPFIVGEKLLCTPGGEQGTLAAFNKKSGEVLWRCSELTDFAQYSSIVTMQHQGRTIGVQLLQKQLVGVDVTDGALVWSTPWQGSLAVIPTPIVDRNRVYVTSGYGAGCMMVRVGTDDSVEKVYDNKLMVNHHGGVILLEGHLYGHSDRKGWTCQKFDTGEKVWQERNSLGKGAIAYADGRFYCLSEDEGSVVLIAASTDGWQEHGRFTLDPQTEFRKPKGRIWVHPVIADGRLYLRDQDLLFCFDIRAKHQSEAVEQE